jgi:siroheme synthase-like protein
LLSTHRFRLRRLGLRDNEGVTTSGADVPSYLAGLRLQGRRVVVLGGGRVARRRLPALVAAGAEVLVIAPEVAPAVARMAQRGVLVWAQRVYRPGDLVGAWYVLAATDLAEVNAQAAREAEEQQTFCVRADDARDATAWTPATAEVDGILVGVLAGRHPRRAAAVRDQLVELLSRLARRAA